LFLEQYHIATNDCLLFLNQKFRCLAVSECTIIPVFKQDRLVVSHLTACHRANVLLGGRHSSAVARTVLVNIKDLYLRFFSRVLAQLLLSLGKLVIVLEGVVVVEADCWCVAIDVIK